MKNKNAIAFFAISAVALCCAFNALGQNRQFEMRLGAEQFFAQPALSLFSQCESVTTTDDERVSLCWRSSGNGWIGVALELNTASLSRSTFDEYCSLTRLGFMARGYTALTETLSAMQGVCLSALWAENNISAANWRDSHTRWGLNAAFNVGIKWQTGQHLSWNIMYEIGGGVLFGKNYSANNTPVTLPSENRKALWGQSFTIGAATTF